MKKVMFETIREALFIVVFLAAVNCATIPPVTQGRFVDAVVSCHTGNDYSDTIVDNVRACLGGAMAGGYAQCLDLLPYAIDEVACVVMDLLNLRVAAVNSGDVQPGDMVVIANAKTWLKDNRISRE